MKTRYFEIAKRLSNKSTYHHKLGCVVVKKNRLLGFGYNKPDKTHPKSNTRFKTTHAELDAILGLELEDLNGSEVYVYRELKDGSLGMSRPCPYCMQMLKLANVKKICYTSEDGYKFELL